MNIPFQQYSSLLITYLRFQWARVVLLAFLLLSSITLQLVDPQILRYFIDTVTSSGVKADLLGIAVLFFGIALLSQALTVASTYVTTNVGWTATNALRTDLARHCLHLDMSFHNTHTPGELIERLDGDITVLSNFFSQLVIQVVGNIFLLIGTMFVLFQLDWRVGVTLGIFVIGTALMLHVMRSFSVPRWITARQISAESYSFLEEYLAGTEDIRSSGAKAYLLRRFIELMRKRLHTQRKAVSMVGIMINSTMLLVSLGTVVAFSVSAYLFFSHLISIGTVYLIYAYSVMLTQPIDQVTQQVGDLQKVGASISRIAYLNNIKTRIVDGKNHFLALGALEVAFQHVSFRYDEHEEVLHNISFHLQPGEVLGLLGRTGCGKTTLARLLLRFHDVHAGTIYLNGQDIRDMRIADLRQHVGMVTQDVQLFHATVRDNLTLFRKHIEDEKILQTLQDLGLWEWYITLPQGLDTELTSSNGLSAGQAQLLALTRIFLADPGLIILDEASSRLDPVTEQMMERAIDKLLSNRSAIIIAHRLTTITRANKILILDQGHVQEFGEQQVLLNDPTSRFHYLFHTELQEITT